MKAKLLVVVAILSIASAALSQVGERITVNVIEVPVTVVDRDGNPVRGLSTANFQLFDDGKLQNITAFDKVDFASDEAVSAISPMNPVARRSFMLLFDLGFSSPTSLARAQEAARNFVKTSVKPRDLVSVGSVDPDHGFRLLAAFTTDRELVESAIAEPTAFRGNDPLQLANNTRTFEATHNEDNSPSSQAPPTGKTGMGDEYQRELSSQVSKANEPFVRARIEKEVNNLGQLASTLRAVPGRKQIILLSEGFDPKYVRGRDVRDSKSESSDLDNLANGQYWAVDSDARFGSTGSMKIIDEMAKLFRGSDVVLHAIDIQGVRVQNDVTTGARINSNEGLFLVSRPTGGEVFRNTNNLNTDFAKMLRQQEVVYVLTFQAQPVKPGKFHNLNVKLVNVPGGRASYRAGYYESAADTPVQRMLTNAEIVMNDIPQNDIRVTAMSSAFPTGTADAQVPVIIEMNGADLLKDVKGDSAAAEVFLYAFDDQGLVRDRAYQKLTLDLKKVGSRLRSGGIKYYATLALPPGRYAIKSLVKLADADRRGFVRTDLVVPKASEIAMMPFFIDEKPTDWLLVKGTAHGGGAYPFAINGETLVPSPAARDAAGKARKLAVVVLNARPNELTLQTNAKVLSRVEAGNATQLILQPDAAAKAVKLAVQKGALVAETTVAQ